MENNALLNEVIAKATTWLNGNYNEETKAEVRKVEILVYFKEHQNLFI
jgi:hypothetical protein